MLGVKSYSQEHIDGARGRIKAQVGAYKSLAAAAKKAKAAPLEKSLDSFEPVFFNNMVLVLDSFFTHRLRGMEGKDGNPLNEVRVLCSSLVENDGAFGADSTIKMNPAKSILGYEVGDAIHVRQAEFVRLAAAFFAEIEKKYT